MENSDKPDQVFVESVLNVSWYTADSNHPYLVKAEVNKDTGYLIIITDMEKTYFCAGDINTILQEKKVINSY